MFAYKFSIIWRMSNLSNKKKILERILYTCQYLYVCRVDCTDWKCSNRRCYYCPCCIIVSSYSNAMEMVFTLCYPYCVCMYQMNVYTQQAYAPIHSQKSSTERLNGWTANYYYTHIRTNEHIRLHILAQTFLHFQIVFFSFLTYTFFFLYSLHHSVGLSVKIVKTAQNPKLCYRNIEYMSKISSVHGLQIMDFNITITFWFQRLFSVYFFK